ncbi:MAG: hypothetical protein ACREI9_10690 [Nitrospiraceae bacterium]
MKHPNSPGISHKARARILGIVALVAGYAMLPQHVLGSGSYDPPGASPSANQAYNLGKSVLHKKLLCEGCPLGGAEPDAGTAPALVDRLQQPDALGNVISAQEREAVVAYLKRRFGL